jgi:histone-lysine N-methyltransferase SETMAR
VAIFAVRRMDVRFEQLVNIKFKHNVTVLPHPPHSPDLSPCDFFSVSTTEKRLKGRRHENIEAIQAAATMELTGIPKEVFTSCFQDLQKRWQQCIYCGGNYFDGDRKH